MLTKYERVRKRRGEQDVSTYRDRPGGSSTHWSSGSSGRRETNYFRRDSHHSPVGYATSGGSIALHNREYYQWFASIYNQHETIYGILRGTFSCRGSDGTRQYSRHYWRCEW